MSTRLFTLGIVIAGLVGALSFLLAWKTLGTAVTAIRLRGVAPGDVREGAVAVTGTPQPVGETVESPWTDADCLAFEGTVSRYESHGGDAQWYTVRSMGRAVPFEVRGPAGAVTVDPDDASLELKETYRAITDGKDVEPPDPEDADPDMSLFAWKQVTNMGNFRYVEERLDPGDTVTVFGVAEYDSPGDRTPRITDGDGWFDPPFAVFASEDSNPLRGVVLRTAVLLGIALLSFGALGWFVLQVL